MTLEIDDILKHEKAEHLKCIHAVRVTETFKSEIANAATVFGEKAIAEIFRRYMREALNDLRTRIPIEAMPV